MLAKEMGGPEGISDFLPVNMTIFRKVISNLTIFQVHSVTDEKKGH